MKIKEALYFFGIVLSSLSLPSAFALDYPSFRKNCFYFTSSKQLNSPEAKGVIGALQKRGWHYNNLFWHVDMSISSLLNPYRSGWHETCRIRRNCYSESTARTEIARGTFVVDLYYRKNFLSKEVVINLFPLRMSHSETYEEGHYFVNELYTAQPLVSLQSRNLKKLENEFYTAQPLVSLQSRNLKKLEAEILESFPICPH